MAVFVDDTFTDTDGDDLDTAHTGEVGADWTDHATTTGTFAVQANRVYCNSAAVAVLYASGVPGDNTYFVEIDMRIVTAAVGSLAALGRLNETETAAETYYMLEWRQSTAVWRLREAISGVFNDLATSASQAPAAGTNVAMRLNMTATNVQGIIDGTTLMDVVESTITAAGRAGIRGGLQATTTTGHHADRFTADDGIAAAVAVIQSVWDVPVHFYKRWEVVSYRLAHRIGQWRKRLCEATLLRVPTSVGPGRTRSWRWLDLPRSGRRSTRST